MSARVGLLLAPPAGRDRRAIRALRRYRLSSERDDSVAGKPVLYRRDTGPTDCDLVLMMDVLEHVDDDRGLLRHYAAKVPPGAHFLVTVPAFAFLWSGHDVFLEHKRRYRLVEIEAAMRDAGIANGLRRPTISDRSFRWLPPCRSSSATRSNPAHLKKHGALTDGILGAVCGLSCRFFRSIAWPDSRRSCWRRRLSRSFLEANERDQSTRESRRATEDRVGPGGQCRLGTRSRLSAEVIHTAPMGLRIDHPRACLSKHRLP